MKRWLLRVSVVLCALAVLATGSWWGWREFYSAQVLLETVKNNDREGARRLLAWGARTDGRDDHDTTLIVACPLAEKDMVRGLVAAGADVNGKAPSGWTPLHAAIAGGTYEIPRFLIDSGADIHRFK